MSRNTTNSSPLLPVARRKLGWLRRQFESRYALMIARNFIKNHPSLLEIINHVNSVSTSIGLSLPDYVSLYAAVRRLKPETVLECGTGKSTFIVAQAMLDNGCKNPKIVSMEENVQWYEISKSIISEKFDFVDVCLSDVGEYKHSIFCGSHYKSVPEYPYDFVLVDAPKMTDENRLNMDFIRVLKNSDKPISAWIDARFITFAVYTALLGRKRVQFYRPWNNTLIENVTSSDLKSVEEIARLFRINVCAKPQLSGF